MAKNYLVGLGFVGTKIIKNLVEISGGKYERKTRMFSFEQLYSERAVEDTEIQIIDMGVDDEKTKKLLDTLIQKHNFTIDDQIYPLRLAEDYYKDDSIRLVMNEYANLKRYYDTFIAPITKYLGPGKGAQRYRPLARYFITRRDSAIMLRNNFNKDVEEDIIGEEGERKATIRIIYVLSAGGGFGSGSILDVNTLLTNALASSEIPSTSKIILNIPAGLKILRLAPEHLPPIDREKGSLASSAALLLELLYLHKMNLGRKPYTDKLLESVSAEVNAKIDNLVGVDEIILTTFANIPGRNIEDIFELHDTEVGRFLYPETREELGPIRENIARIYNEYMTHISGVVSDFAKELLIPITVIGVTSIQIDPTKTIRVVKEINNVTNIIKNLNEQKEMLERERMRLMDELEKLEYKLADLKETESKITREAVERSPDVIQVSRKIMDLKGRITYMLIPLIGKIVDEIYQLKGSGRYEEIENSIQSLRSATSTALNAGEVLEVLDMISGSKEEIKALIARQVLDKNDIVSLVKHLLILENSKGVLEFITGELEKCADKIRILRDDIRPGYIDKLFNKSRSRAYSNLGAVHEIVVRQVEEYKRKIADADMVAKRAKDKHNEFIENLKKEIGNTSKALDDIRKKIKELDLALSNIVAQLRENETKMLSLYQELSTYLLRDLQRYYGDLLRQITIQKFVEILISKGVLSEEGPGSIGVAGIIEVIRKINGVVAENIIGAIIQYMNDLKYFVNIEPENVDYLGKILGIDSSILRVCLVEDKYIVASPDNEELANLISKKLNLTRPPFIIKGAKTSFITYVKRKIVLPLQVKEVRNCLSAYFEKVKRRIRDSVVEEYRGLAYMVLDLENTDLIEYVERVKKSLEEFEKKYESLLKGQSSQ